MDHAGVVGTMDAAAQWPVAALAASLPKVFIYYSDDAQLWVVDLSGPISGPIVVLHAFPQQGQTLFVDVEHLQAMSL